MTADPNQADPRLVDTPEKDGHPLPNVPADFSPDAASSDNEKNQAVSNQAVSNQAGTSAREASENTKGRAIKIGSQRDEPTSSSANVETDLRVPPQARPDTDQPNADQPTSPNAAAEQTDESYFPQPLAKGGSLDLEDEIAAALGGKSLDELIAMEDSATQGAMLEADTRLSARVVKIHRENVFFTLGGRDEGIAPLKQFAEPPEINATLDVNVVKYDASEGLYELSIPGASVSVGDWSDISEGMVVEARVTGHNTGGLECDVNNLRGFIPVSQISLYRVDDMEQFVDQRLQCVVVEANPERRNLVLSHRGLLEREQETARQSLMDELEVGQLREGVVRRIQDFGAFVDLGGVDGLVHISRLSWDRVNHPSDVLEEGQRIEVKVEKIDPDTGKIGLSYRDTTVHPWDGIDAKYSTGMTASGKVTRIAKFGAFVRLEAGIEGLIHISELAHHRVQNVASVVSEGQEVEVKVLSVDREAQRMSLSLKAMMSAPQAEEADDTPDEPQEPTVPQFKGELKGGTNRPTGGEQFGLQW